MDTCCAIKYLQKKIKNPSVGLPESIFYFVSRLTPMVNVDLLVKDENGRILLSWRDDKYYRAGWHIPGGIVRFKEKLKVRVREVAKQEIGAVVRFEPEPIAIREFICHRDTRGHFISLLYKCFLSSKFTPQNKNLKKNDNGYLMWHDSCPENLIEFHKKAYKDFI